MSQTESPTAPTAETTPFERIGGAPGVRALVHRFYELMDTLPEAYGIRKLHAADLSGSEEKLFLYLQGWMGGPDTYVQQNGHPRLRQRHLPFPIASDEARQWMMCMRQALDETVADAVLREKLFEAFNGLADHMRNRPD